MTCAMQNPIPIVLVWSSLLAENSSRAPTYGDDDDFARWRPYLATYVWLTYLKFDSGDPFYDIIIL